MSIKVKDSVYVASKQTNIEPAEEIKSVMDRMAKLSADYARANLFRIHRGVLDIFPGAYAIYGNDGYGYDDRAKAEAMTVRAHAMSISCMVSDIHTCDEGYTWAVVVLCDEETSDEFSTIAKKTWNKLTDDLKDKKSHATAVMAHS